MGINTKQFYIWKKKLISSGEIFSERGREIQELMKKNSRLKDMIAEITAENLKIKKRLGSLAEEGKDMKVRFFLVYYGQLIEALWYLFYREEPSFKKFLSGHIQHAGRSRGEKKGSPYIERSGSACDELAAFLSSINNNERRLKD